MDGIKAPLSSNEVTAGRCPHGISLTADPPCHFCDHQQYVEWVTPQLERLGREMVNNDQLREALQCLLPGLVLDLRYATDDDDKDAMRSRIETVQDALAGTAVETKALQCSTHAAEHRVRDTLPCPWCVIDELKRNRDRLAAETPDDPLAGVRWICRSCTTVNGIDDAACLGCQKPREEHDSRVKSTAPISKQEPLT